jgi:hypothetical protein
MADTVKELTKKLRGFAAYFRLAETKGALEEVDQWIRRRLRAIKWRQWKRPRTRARELMRREVGGRQGEEVGLQRAWPVMEHRRFTHEPGLPHQIL